MNASEARYQTADVPRADRQIRLGSFLFTMVEPHKGHEVAYNRWYERDHFYAGCMIGAYQFAGARFVATRDCKKLRYPQASPVTQGDPMRGSYLAIYWVLDGHHDDWNVWGVDQVNWLHKNDRMFAHRDHVHTLLYKYAGEQNGPGSHTPAELALDRMYAGIVVLIGEASAGTKPEAISKFFAERPCPADLMVAGAPLPMLANRPADVPDDKGADRFVQIYFTEKDPIADWDRYVALARDFEHSGLGRIVFSSPFLRTVVGTDRYTDQLW